MGLIRLIVFAFVVLSIVYVSVTLWSRAVHRDRLRKQWVEEGSVGDVDRYVEKGMIEYRQSFRRHLTLAVYVVPAVVVGLLVYFVNYA